MKMRHLCLFLWVFILHTSVLLAVSGSNDEGSGDDGSGVDMDPNTTYELDLELTLDLADSTEDPMHMDEALLNEEDWLPVGQMVTDIGLLYQGQKEKAVVASQDDESSDLENLHVCAKTLNDFASLPNYLTKALVQLYSEASSDIPGTLNEEQVLDMLGPQNDEGDLEESYSITDADLETAVKEMVDDETENKLRQEVVASMREIKDPLDGNLVTRIVALARSLHAIQNMRCRNLCTSTMCMNGAGLCNLSICNVRKCPIVCFDSNMKYPQLNVCQDRPNVVHGIRMYCCPHNFHPVVNVTGETVKCYC